MPTWSKYFQHTGTLVNVPASSKALTDHTGMEDYSPYFDNNEDILLDTSLRILEMLDKSLDKSTVEHSIIEKDLYDDDVDNMINIAYWLLEFSKYLKWFDLHISGQIPLSVYNEKYKFKDPFPVHPDHESGEVPEEFEDCVYLRKELTIQEEKLMSLAGVGEHRWKNLEERKNAGEPAKLYLAGRLLKDKKLYNAEQRRKMFNLYKKISEYIKINRKFDVEDFSLKHPEFNDLSKKPEEKKKKKEETKETEK